MLEPHDPGHLQQSDGALGTDLGRGSDELEEAVMAVLRRLQPFSDKGAVVRPVVGQPKQRMIPGCADNRGACISSVAFPSAHMAPSSVPGGETTYVFLWLLTGVSPFLHRM